MGDVVVVGVDDKSVYPPEVSIGRVDPFAAAHLDLSRGNPACEVGARRVGHLARAHVHAEAVVRPVEGLSLAVAEFLAGRREELRLLREFELLEVRDGAAEPQPPVVLADKLDGHEAALAGTVLGIDDDVRDDPTDGVDDDAGQASARTVGAGHRSADVIRLAHGASVTVEGAAANAARRQRGRVGVVPTKQAKRREIQHPSRAERVERGKAARSVTPRSSLGLFEPAAKRADPVKLLEKQAVTRVPELLPIRYGRMLASPFTFYRGAALLMAEDLAPSPVSGMKVQACGDAHMTNFGVFASPERNLVFDANDFDETLPGPWEWDVKRLLTSLLIGARDAGFSRRDQERVVRARSIQYRAAMAGFAGMGNLAVWYAHIDMERLMTDLAPLLRKDGKAHRAHALQGAQPRQHIGAHEAHARRRRRAAHRLRPAADRPHRGADGLGEGGAKRSTPCAGCWRVPCDARVRSPRPARAVPPRRPRAQGSRRGKRRHALLDRPDARRRPKDPLFLQIKEAGTSVLEGPLGPSEYSNHGERVVAGQHLMQAVSDIFLGWLRVPAREGEPSRDFYGRQLRDGKGSFEVEGSKPDGFAIYGRVCAWTLARAHARSGDRVAIASYLGSGDAFDRAMVQFAVDYAEQNERDYSALKEAVDSGQIAAESGV